jgi:hypothetical protein
MTRSALKNVQGLAPDSGASEADTAQTDLDPVGNNDASTDNVDASEMSAGTEVPATSIADCSAVPPGPDDPPGMQGPGPAVPEYSPTARDVPLGPAIPQMHLKRHHPNP